MHLTFFWSVALRQVFELSVTPSYLVPFAVVKETSTNGRPHSPSYAQSCVTSRVRKDSLMWRNLLNSVRTGCGDARNLHNTTPSTTRCSSSDGAGNSSCSLALALVRPLYRYHYEIVCEPTSDDDVDDQVSHVVFLILDRATAFTRSYTIAAFLI